MILITIRYIELNIDKFNEVKEHYVPTTWTPYFVDDWNQPGLNDYFYMNGYFYPVF